MKAMNSFEVKKFTFQIITRRLENEGNTLTSRLGVLHEAIDIFSNVRPTLPNNENVEKLTRLLFV